MLGRQLGDESRSLGPAEEGAQSGEAPVDGGGLPAFDGAQVALVVPQIGGGHRPGTEGLTGTIREPAGEGQQVDAVGRDGLGGQIPATEVVQKLGDVRG